MIALLRRKPGVTPEEFADYWKHVHAPLVRSTLPGLRKYVLNFVQLGPNVVVQLGYPPKRIDLLTSIDGVTFDECYANRADLELGSGVRAPLISLEDLETNKRAAGRLQALADVEALET